jgi:hypothetical protein
MSAAADRFIAISHPPARADAQLPQNRLFKSNKSIPASEFAIYRSYRLKVFVYQWS